MMTPYTPHNEGQGQFPENSMSSLPGNETEVAQLLLQHRQLSELMGGILPPILEPSWGSRVLVIGWSLGGLVYEMAWRFPSLHISGIDANVHAVEEARTLVKDLDNVTVFAHDIHHLNDEVFPPASFDLIQLRFLAANVTPQQFPPLMQSLGHTCRPGGLIVWTEGEWPITTSLACQRLSMMVQKGLQASGRAFTPGNSLGVTARMSRWLGDAGFRIRQSRAYAIDISAGSKGHDAFVLQVRLSGEHLRTFLLEMNVTTATEFEEIYLEMQREIEEEQFCGMLYLRTLVGVRL
jgi:SAM-dependent methyltransferase